MLHDATQSRRQRWLRFEVAFFALIVFFMAMIHEAATQDRLLLILYSLGTAGGAYGLVNRRAFGLAAIIVATFGATLMAATYYAATPDDWHPLLDPIRDLAGLGILLFLTAMTVLQLYRFEREERLRQLKQQVEKKTVEMRAAALRSTSHEVRTPIATITAIAETLLDESCGTLSETQREFIGDIDAAARHLLALVNDILDYAKAEAGMIKLSLQPVALPELVEQCVEMVEPRAHAAGVSVSAHISPELNEIVADPLRLKQILLNLLTNAIKYNDQGGTVNVRARPDHRDTVLIAVRDTGRGIALEHMGHLFDPYYQAAVADQGIGTGLGLAILKHLTELHGGTVSVESVPGSGSVFNVRLPRTLSAAVAAKSPRDPAAENDVPSSRPDLLSAAT